ncbi:SDR family oxidoreductase [Sphingomonas sp. CGMCC 1.13654]|uniref:SDR family oxidoreductase n=1 Tax=Sphingomonas chungangi TaxID=2683589 RepID=A0A838L6N0_9SPHN|nr:SDR family oxidoreductase [Sphingomonas chungangi]MBA2934590.1 SDR family oxidoreductase [Sphingomonas chungangi]MVW57626.1 SDR family NAD(P)-dependent oxidoreductase [Sphingomonas chungangi]
MKVQGSIVFITGANRGLGLAFARQARALGAAKVYAGMRKVEGFDESGLIPVQIDVTDPQSVAAAVLQAADVTLLVNNAGIGGSVRDALDDHVEEVSRAVFEVNYHGVVRVSQSFAPILARSEEAGIINILSNASWLPVPFLTPYGVSKAAAWSYTNHLRLALKQQGTRVVALHVGYVDTDLTAGLNLPKSNPDDVARIGFVGLEEGRLEVLVDEKGQRLKHSLSSNLPGYVEPDPYY